MTSIRSQLIQVPKLASSFCHYRCQIAATQVDLPLLWIAAEPLLTLFSRELKTIDAWQIGRRIAPSSLKVVGEDEFPFFHSWDMVEYIICGAGSVRYPLPSVESTLHAFYVRCYI